LSHTGSCSIVKTRTELTAAMTNEDLENIESWLSALESLIALLIAQLPAAAGARLAAALREATAPELNARLSWSAALQRVRLLIGYDDE
jgi:hypothetical protein